MKQRSMFWVLVCCVSVGGWLVGCGHHGHDRDAAAEGAEPAFEEAAAIVEVSPEMEAVLARADLADGTEDHVVAKCSGCGLAMDGSADHVLNVGEYELHFCSDSCQGRVENDVTGALMALAETEESDSEATP